MQRSVNNIHISLVFSFMTGRYNFCDKLGSNFLPKSSTIQKTNKKQKQKQKPYKHQLKAWNESYGMLSAVLCKS